MKRTLFQVYKGCRWICIQYTYVKDKKRSILRRRRKIFKTLVIIMQKIDRKRHLYFNNLEVLRMEDFQYATRGDPGSLQLIKISIRNPKNFQNFGEKKGGGASPISYYRCPKSSVNYTEIPMPPPKYVIFFLICKRPNQLPARSLI